MNLSKPLQADVLAVSPSFKKEATKSVLSIVYFIVVYCLLFLFSLCLAAACAYGGIALIAAFPKFITLLAGGGLIGVGIMVVIFLVKFLFTRSRADESDSIQITQNDQPELVRFINKIAEETGTIKPKKIFISGDVNACVFYDSSFWSMFFPVKKNLKIGIGLVNSVNISEFKAVVAHEFGHFSQRSMKVGSYVYQTNKIIHDMLFNNDSYAKSIDKWSNLNGIFSLFAVITVHIVKAIQFVLAKMYALVNKSYMSLSRQMEFHADLVASSVAGKNNIISALKRIEFSDYCYSTTLDLYGQRLAENKVMQDVYRDHQAVMKHVSNLNQVPLVDGLPMPGVLFENSGSRVNYKDQWASHPTLKEREDYLSSFELEGDVDTTPAWHLFNNATDLKHRLTQLLYRNVPVQDKQVIDASQFDQLYVQQLEQYSFPEVYKGYYDQRQIDIFDTDVNGPVGQVPFEALLTVDTSKWPKKMQMLTQDIAVLESIKNKEIDVKTFDFDGQKYDRSHAHEIKQQLEEELKQLQVSVAALDKDLYLYFYHKMAFEKAENLRSAYNLYFGMQKDADAFLEKANGILEFVHNAWNGIFSVDDAKAQVLLLKGGREKEFKDQLKQYLENGTFHSDPEFLDKAKNFTLSDYQYFDGTTFFDNELNDLNYLSNGGWSSIQDDLFAKFKKILQMQAELVLENKEIVV